MRLYIKRQCLEILSLLDEAHAEFIISLINNRAEAALEMLEQCQQGAISVGTMIDKSEGEGTEEVHLLERYCDRIWQVSEDVKNGGEINVQKTEEMLRKLLLDVLNGIEKRIPTQREVFFLPYKASMWDSLESVWRKLNADPDVTARVMPIPYYDKNPDGTYVYACGGTTVEYSIWLIEPDGDHVIREYTSNGGGINTVRPDS